jgi:hypothetical protein
LQRKAIEIASLSGGQHLETFRILGPRSKIPCFGKQGIFSSGQGKRVKAAPLSTREAGGLYLDGR